MTPICIWHTSQPIPTTDSIDTVRVGGAPAGAGTDGWRFDPVSGELQADDRQDTDGDGIAEHTRL